MLLFQPKEFKLKMANHVVNNIVNNYAREHDAM